MGSLMTAVLTLGGMAIVGLLLFCKAVVDVIDELGLMPPQVDEDEEARLAAFENMEARRGS